MRLPTALVLAALAAVLVPLAPATAAPTCHGRAATVLGTARDDVLVGTPGDDVILGLAGADRIEGRGGDDVLCGGAGFDRLAGGLGDDLLDPGAGDRPLGAGQDVVDWSDAPRGVVVDLGRGTASGEGSDVVVPRTHALYLLTPFDDVLRGTGGTDSLIAGRGDDVVEVRGGRDLVATGPGADQVWGGGGDDSVFSGPGPDTVRAGRGDDEVKDVGGSGADDLAAGAGDDVVTDRMSAADGQRWSLGRGDDLLTFEPSPLGGRYDGTWDMRSGRLAMAGPRPFDATATGVESADLPLRVGFEVTGTDGDEFMTAGGRYFRFSGLAGDDTFIGTRGDDVFDGGAGRDVALFVGPGDDTCVSVEVFRDNARPRDCESRTP